MISVCYFLTEFNGVCFFIFAEVSPELISVALRPTSNGGAGRGGVGRGGGLISIMRARVRAFHLALVKSAGRAGQG